MRNEGIYRVFLLAGQSNAGGSSGRFNVTTPGMQPTGLNLNYFNPTSAIQYAERIVVRADSSTAYDAPYNSPFQRRTDSGRFSAELSLGRALNGIRPSHWSPYDKVVFLKYASPGSNIDHWLPGHETGNQEVFTAWLQGILAQLDRPYTSEALFWIQGEADSDTIASLEYVAKFQQMMSVLDQTAVFTPVFAALKDRPDGINVTGAQRINQEMAAAGYAVTVDNNDLDFLSQPPVDIHFTADSTIELGHRLFDAYQGI